MQKGRTPTTVKEAQEGMKAEAKVLLDLIDKAEEEREQEKKRTPGAIIRGSKVPWTQKDVDAAYPPVTFVPEENIPVTFQGVTYWLFADRETTVPSVVKNIYDQHRRLERERGRGVTTPSGEFVPVRGVGALPPE